MFKQLLLQNTWLWKTRLTLHTGLHEGTTGRKPSYTGVIEAYHILFAVNYLYAFYWYGNIKGIPVHYKFLGSYDISNMRKNAINESIKLSTHGNKHARSKSTSVRGLPDPDSVGWRDLGERTGTND